MAKDWSEWRAARAAARREIRFWLAAVAAILIYLLILAMGAGHVPG